MNEQEQSLVLLSTKDAAQRLGVSHWKVRRVYERGLLPDPPRVGRQRALRESDLAALREVLSKNGYLC